ncbi:MAG: transposase [Pyrinomonadaceae bacterium]
MSADIEKVLPKEFADYGYLKVTHWLRQEKGYLVNPKKIYRLMAEHDLLNRFVPRKRRKRNWVKDLLPNAVEAFDYIEFDIKYVYVAGLGRNALVLTLIDVKRVRLLSGASRNRPLLISSIRFLRCIRCR